MKVLLLADSNSPHTLRWSKSLAEHKVEISIFSIHVPSYSLYNDTPAISIFSLNAPRELQLKSETSISKFIYLKSVKKVKKMLEELKPDILHSHYASSYGLIGALSGFHPYIISVWGSDVTNFPKQSAFHKSMLKFSLSKADQILATSFSLSKATKKYTTKQIVVTPFGIDIKKFYSQKVKSIFEDSSTVIGTIKTLEKRYGIEYLVRAFAIVKDKFKHKKLKLLLVGEGTQRAHLEKLVLELGIENDTVFTGFVNHNEIGNCHNMLDIFVAVSLEESFGVAVLEASACGKPVVVSNVGGFSEVVENNKTGFIVDKENPEMLAAALEKLIDNEELRQEMGINGRQKVINEYSWQDSVSKLLSVYDSILK